MQAFACEICADPYPVSLLNEHHKKPQALGGTDHPSNIAKLCAGCHQALHSIAHMMVNPKRRHEIDAAAVALFPQDQNARTRLLRLASLVARELVLKKEIRKPPREELKIMVTLPSRYLELIKQAGMDMPNRHGRRAGVSRVLRHVVAEFLMRKFPAHRAEVMDMFTPTPRKQERTTVPDPDAESHSDEEADGFDLQSEE